MKRHTSLALLTAVALGLGAATLARAGETAGSTQELARLQATYQEQLAKIDRGEKDAQAALQKQYIEALGALEGRMQTAGNLEALLAVRAERSRFDQKRELRADEVSLAVRELAACQTNYLKAVEERPVLKARRVVALADLYDRELAALQARLTREGQVDAAIQVRAEREALNQRPEVTAARFVKADSEARQPASAPAVPAPVPARPATNVAVAVIARKFAGTDKSRVQKRYESLYALILKQDWKAATDYLDPQYVERQGSDMATRQLQFAWAFLRLTDSPAVKVQAGEVTFGEDGQTASLVPRLWAANQWRDMPPVKWILVEGDWYVNMDAGDRPLTVDPAQIESSSGGSRRGGQHQTGQQQAPTGWRDRGSRR